MLPRHVIEGLHLHRVGRGTEALEDPVARALVTGGTGYARPELHLVLEVLEGARAHEFARAAGAAAGAGECEREARRRVRQAALSHGHRGKRSGDVL